MLLDLEFPDSEGKPTVGGQIGVTKKSELGLEVFGFGERFAVKEADADQLPVASTKTWSLRVLSTSSEKISTF